jgi:hypothetical protein
MTYQFYIIIKIGGYMNVDLYELAYRNYQLFEKEKSDTIINISDLVISENTNKNIKIVLKELQYAIPKNERISISDIEFYKRPIFDENNNLIYWHSYLFINGDKKVDPYRYLENFNRFNIDNLPLIEVAKYLNIKIEKSHTIEVYGRYMDKEKKILLGTDSARTFIHELSHAVDYIFLNENYTEEYFFGFSEHVNIFEEEYVAEYLKIFGELVAELSTVLLCKIYNIPNDISYSKYYLDSYSNLELNIESKYIIKRVSLICEYINKCIENSKMQK